MFKYLDKYGKELKCPNISNRVYIVNSTEQKQNSLLSVFQWYNESTHEIFCCSTH